MIQLVSQALKGAAIFLVRHVVLTIVTVASVLATRWTLLFEHVGTFVFAPAAVLVSFWLWKFIRSLVAPDVDEFRRSGEAGLAWRALPEAERLRWSIIIDLAIGAMVALIIAACISL